MEFLFEWLKLECLERIIFFGQKSLENAVRDCLELYNAERNYLGLDNELIQPNEGVGAVAGEIERRERLGGILKYRP